jgi:AbrB family looped-hinge helix DNA binding protein
MARKKKDGCCAPTGVKPESCRVEAVVSVDDRGQMVLPKELRERAGIKPSDKLVAATWEKDGRVCCITLVKVEDFVSLLKDHLGPVMKEIM